jgi:hypothetical protein
VGRGQGQYSSAVSEHPEKTPRQHGPGAECTDDVEFGLRDRLRVPREHSAPSCVRRHRVSSAAEPTGILGDGFGRYGARTIRAQIDHERVEEIEAGLLQPLKRVYRRERRGEGEQQKCEYYTY